MESSCCQLSRYRGRSVVRGQGAPLCRLPCYGRLTDDGMCLSPVRGRAVSMCADVSANSEGLLLYKKFLAEGLPIESHLPTHLLHDYFLVEIENKQDAMA
jgi:hypothetical protein